MSEDKIVTVVRETTDYSQFKNLKGNRELGGRPEKIKASIIANGYILNPIVVNEFHEVIDGQGRLKALRELEMPIHYIEVEGLRLKDCIAMNAKSTPWTVQDYIDSYVLQGNENYIRLKQLTGEHLLNANAVLRIAKGYYGGGNCASVGADAIRSGEIIITDQEAAAADKVLSYIDTFKNVLSKVGGYFIYWGYAISFCYDLETIDNTRLYNQVMARSTDMRPCAKVTEALKDLETVYNYKCKNKVRILVEYEDKCNERISNYRVRWGSKRPK